MAAVNRNTCKKGNTEIFDLFPSIKLLLLEIQTLKLELSPVRRQLTSGRRRNYEGRQANILGMFEGHALHISHEKNIRKGQKG